VATRTYTARQFTNAVYRRLLLLRVVEQLGRGVLVGSAVATLLMLIAIWQALPTQMILVFSGGIGLLVGVGFAIVNRPTRWQSIVETDRQLGFDDLLATALSVGPVIDEFNNTVIAVADARCSHRSPSEVLIRQLGFRSWSAIGLTTCVAVTLALIPVNPSRSQASDISHSILAGTAAASPLIDPALPSGSLTAMTNNPGSENAQSTVMPTSTAQEGLKTSTDSAGSKSMDLQRTGASGGRAGSPEKSSQLLQTGDAAAAQNSNSTVGGGGGPAQPSAGRGTASGGAVSPGHGRIKVASPTGAKSGDNGESGFPDSDNPIPAEDRQMVREFFQK
jgi:hypothetical protein